MTTEQMQELFGTSDRLVGEDSLEFHRYLYGSSVFYIDHEM